MPGIDEKENEWRVRVRDPGDFKPESFRRKKISDGVAVVIGKLKDPPKGEEDSMVNQGYRFDKKKFPDKESVRAWLKKYKMSYMADIGKWVLLTEGHFPLFLEDDSQSVELKMDQETALSELTDAEIEGWWDVARAGTWDGTLEGKNASIKITLEDLQAMAEDYDPELHYSPVTTDHVKEGTALAWVAALRVAGDKLQAKFEKISDTLRDWIKSGAFINRSIEYHKPFKPTGKAYLTGLSFLGAAKPAVKGLSPRPVLFQGRGEPSIAVCFNKHLTQGETTMKDEEKNTIVNEVVEKVKGLFKSTDDPTIKLTEEIAELKSQLAAKEAAEKEAEEKVEALTKERDEAKNKLAEDQKKAELAEFSAGLDKLVSAGKVIPAEKEGFVKLAENQSAEQRKQLLDTLDARGESRIFSELTKADPQDPETVDAAEIEKAKFKDFPDDPDHDKALELMAKDKELSFSEAMRRVRVAGAMSAAKS